MGPPLSGAAPGRRQRVEIDTRLAEKLPEWEAFDIVPSETIPGWKQNDDRPSSTACRSGETCSRRASFSATASASKCSAKCSTPIEAAGRLDDLRKAAYGYLALSLDKLLNYNSRMSVWMPTREVVANTFNRHDFAFCWSYAEMAPLDRGSRLRLGHRDRPPSASASS